MNKKEFIERYAPKCFYHFTDIRNIPSIRESGLLSHAELVNSCNTTFYPAGNTISQEVDADKGLNKYVHLCLHHKHPMEYIAKREGRVGNTVFLSVTLDVLDINGVFFTGEVANKSGVCLLEPENAYSELDLEVLYDGLNFGDPQIRKRHNIAVKYELLVPNHVPLEYLNLPQFI